MPSVYAGLVPRRWPAQHVGQATPSDSACPDGQLIDASTWQCVPMCPDDTRPCGGQCVQYSGAPLPVQGSSCANVGTPIGHTRLFGVLMPKWVVWAGAVVVGYILLRFFAHHAVAAG